MRTILRWFSLQKKRIYVKLALYTYLESIFKEAEDPNSQIIQQLQDVFTDAVVKEVLKNSETGNTEK